MQANADQSIKAAYERMAYESLPHATSHPRRLALGARLFGLTPPPLETARILELGCAAGGNLLPVAARYPQSECVGIDLAPSQIEAGRAAIAAHGLRNARLEVLSLTDLTPAFGAFDYIVAHGLLSWVPPEVQPHVLRVCKENLSPDGVAFINYNALPGWNGVRSIRDMMLMHTAAIEDPAHKVQEAIKFLELMLAGQTGEDPAWRLTLQQELALLRQSAPWYIFHDHLGTENHAFYLHQFADMADRAGLRYLGDTDLTMMFLGNMAPAIIEALAPLGDLAKQEQYMDFVRNARFRSSLLCHRERTPQTTVPNDRLLAFGLTSVNLAPDFDTTDHDWLAETPRRFGKGFVSTPSGSCALLLTLLHEQGERPITVQGLVELAAQRIGAQQKAALQAQLLELGIPLAFRGRIQLHEGATGEAASLAARPEVWRYARKQAEQGRIVTNLRHQSVTLDDTMRLFAALWDGSRTRAEIPAAFLAKVAEAGGSLTHPDGSRVATEREKLKMAEEMAQQSAQQFLDRHLLVA